MPCHSTICRHQVEKALRSFKAAGHEGEMLRKHHWSLHLPCHLAKWHFLPNCWPLERKHKVVTKYATNTKKLTTYDKSLLEETLCQDLYNLKTSEHFLPGVQLVGKHVVTTKFHEFLCQNVFKENIGKANVWTARIAKLEKGGTAASKDFVLLESATQWGWQVAKMEHHFETQGAIYSLLFSTKLVEYNPATNTAVVELEETLHFANTSMILCSVMFAKEQQNHFRVLIPWPWRPARRS